MLAAQPFVIHPRVHVEFHLRVRIQKGADHPDRARRIEDVNDALPIVLRDLHRGVGAARGCAADQQRQTKFLPLHFLRDMDHLVERRRDQSAQTNDVGLFLAGGLENLLRRHHHAEIDHVVVITLQHDADDVLADVVHVAFHRRHHDSALRFRVGLLFGFHERHEVGDRLLHDARAFHHLRKKHFPGAKQIAHHAHAGHERPFDHVERARGFLARLLGVALDMFDDTFDERVRESFLDWRTAPRFILRRDFSLRFHLLGEIDQPLGRVRPPVEEHILNQFAQRRVDLFVNGELPGVDDRHVEPGADGVIQKRGMHRFAHRVVAAKGERNVAHPAADARAGEVGLDPARRLDEGDRVIVVFLDAGRDGQDVRIKNDVVRREAGALGQQAVGARANGRSCVPAYRPGRVRRRPSR